MSSPQDQKLHFHGEIASLEDTHATIFELQTNDGFANVNAIIDSGNSLKADAAISEAAAVKLRLKVKEAPVTQVKTAGESYIQVLGCIGPIQLRLRNGKNTEVYNLDSALVLRGLSVDMNLGFNFLRKNRMSLGFNQTGSYLKTTKSNREWMIQQLADSSQLSSTSCSNDKITKESSKEINVECKSQIFYPTAKYLIEPNSYKILCFRPESAGMAKSGTTWTLPPKFYGSSLIVPSGMYEIKEDNCLEAFIVNPGIEPVVLPADLALEATLVEKRKCNISNPNPHCNSNSEVVQSMEDMAFNESEQTSAEEIWKKLKLDNNELLASNKEVSKKVKALIKRYQKVFSLDKYPGKTDLIKCRLVLKDPDAVPVREKARPLNPKLRADLKSQISEMMKKGIIEEAPESEWASPVVPVQKKSGEVRWCQDYRKLNNLLVKNSYPLPNISQLLEEQAGKKIYSSIDCIAAYHSIEVAESSRDYTTFITPFGLFRYGRMPFGIQAAPGIYSRLISLVVSGMDPESCAAYLDDLLLSSNDLKSHVKVLEEVLQRYYKAGIKINPSKTELFKTNVKYLGFILSSSGISMDDQYLKTILEWPRPTTPKMLSRFLGFVTYYQSFIKNFSALTAAMNGQRRKKTLEWTEAMEKNFQTLKELFRCNPIRKPPNYSPHAEPFILTTDYSCKAMGAVLSQLQQGKEHLIGCAGRKCTPGEANYPSYKGEMASLVFGIKKFARILSFKKFIVYTDNNCLLHLRTFKPTTGLEARWLSYLNCFDFEVNHKKGSLNTNADAISREENLVEEATEEDLNYQCYDTAICAIQMDTNTIVQKQKEDVTLLTVRQWIEEAPDKKRVRGETKELQFYYNILPTLLIEDDVLKQKVTGIMGQVKRILLPEPLWQGAFQACHNAAVGHFSIAATCARMLQRFIYYGLRTDVQNRVRACAECIQKDTQVKMKLGLHVPAVAGFPLQTCYIDLVGPWPKTERGNCYLLTVLDGWSRFFVCQPIPDKSATTVAQAIVTSFINYFGAPHSIHSDRGTEFTAKVFSEVMKILGVTHNVGPAYNPWSNLVERVHRTLSSMLRSVLPREERNWDRYCHLLMLAYNSKVCASTGVTPAVAFLGRELSLPVDLMLPVQQQTLQIDKVADHYKKRLSQMYHYILRKQQGTIRRNTQLYSQNKNPYKKNDKVLFLATRTVPNKPAKITRAWLGPFTVEEVLSNVLINISDYKKKVLTVHIGRVRHCPTSMQKKTIPEDWNREDGDELCEDLSLGEDVKPQDITDSFHIDFQPDDSNTMITDIVAPTPSEVSENVIEAENATAIEDEGKAKTEPPKRGSIVRHQPISIPTRSSKRLADTDISTNAKRPELRGVIRTRDVNDDVPAPNSSKREKLSYQEATSALDTSDEEMMTLHM